MTNQPTDDIDTAVIARDVSQSELIEPLDMQRQPSVKLVQIEWQDSHFDTPKWQHVADITQRKALSSVSVGYLIQDDDNAKVLAPNMADVVSETNIQAGGIITIPTCAVISVTELTEITASSLVPV